jgi:hypothetical protein
MVLGLEMLLPFSRLPVGPPYTFLLVILYIPAHSYRVTSYGRSQGKDIRFSNSGFCALYLGWYVAKESKFCFGTDSHLFSLQPALLLKQLELMLITCDPLIRGMGTVCSHNLQVILRLTLSQATVSPHLASTSLFVMYLWLCHFLAYYVHTTLE